VSTRTLFCNNINCTKNHTYTSKGRTHSPTGQADSGPEIQRLPRPPLRAHTPTHRIEIEVFALNMNERDIETTVINRLAGCSLVGGAPDIRSIIDIKVTRLRNESHKTE
jgi:hypothetical protein